MEAGRFWQPEPITYDNEIPPHIIFAALDEHARALPHPCPWARVIADLPETDPAIIIESQPSQINRMTFKYFSATARMARGPLRGTAVRVYFEVYHNALFNLFFGSVVAQRLYPGRAFHHDVC